MKKTIKRQYVIDYIVAQIKQNNNKIDSLQSYYEENTNLDKKSIDVIFRKKIELRDINLVLGDIVREIEKA